LPWFALLCAAALAPVTHGYTPAGVATQTAGMSVLAVAFATLVLHAALGETAGAGWRVRLLALGALRSVGRYSYAMYVFHYPLHVFVGVRLLARIAPHVDWRVALLYLGC